MAEKENITIENLETLATELEADAKTQHARLRRLCVAYARILAAREPEKFRRRATHYGDEAGHWDSSYPPKMEYSDRTGPRSISLIDSVTEDVATSGGYYHAWRRTCESGALAIDADGAWWRGDETGTGSVGQYAAHPGDCGVDVTISWSRESSEDVSLAELHKAEGRLRKLAFPLVAERAATAND